MASAKTVSHNGMYVCASLWAVKWASFWGWSVVWAMASFPYPVLKWVFQTEAHVRPELVHFWFKVKGGTCVCVWGGFCVSAWVSQWYAVAQMGCEGLVPWRTQLNMCLHLNGCVMSCVEVCMSQVVVWFKGMHTHWCLNIHRGNVHVHNTHTHTMMLCADETSLPGPRSEGVGWA